jgi:exosortase A
VTTFSNRKSFLTDPALVAMGLSPGRQDSEDGGLTTSPAAGTWRMAWCALVIGIAAIIALFWATSTQMVHVWRVSASFNHGFLILPICGYLIWLKRGALANLAPRPSGWGLGLIGVSGVVWLLGYVGSVSMVQQFAVVFMLQGLFLAILGFAVVRVILFPLGYMLFAVPAGLFLIPQLQDITAIIVVKGLQLLNIPVFLDGVFISIPTGNFEVAEACSGVRFLIATIALGTLFAHLSYKSRARQLAFIGLSIVIPIIANGIRAFGIVLLAYLSDNEIAVGVDHIVYGWIFFAFITIILLLVGMTFRDGNPEEVSVDPNALAALGKHEFFIKRIAIVGAGAIFLSAAAPAYASHIASRPLPQAPAALPVPGIGNGWQASPSSKTSWNPVYPAAHVELLQRYEKGGAQVDLYVAYYVSQSHGVELISNRNQLTDETGSARRQLNKPTMSRAASGTRTMTVEGSPTSVYWVRLLGRGQANRVAYRWYWVAGQLTSNKYYAKILQAMQKLYSGRDTSAAIVISTTYDENWTDAEETLRDFLGSVKPVSSLLQDVSQKH